MSDKPPGGELRNQRHLRALAAARTSGDVAGEKVAMAELLAPYWKWTRSIAYARLRGVSNRSAGADEIAQEVMIRMVKTLSGKTNFNGPFQAVVAENLRWAVNDFWRQQKAELASPSDPAEIPEPWAEDRPSDRWEADAFDSYLIGLSERDQALLKNRILGDMSVAEIASHHRISEPAVHTALHRGLRKIRENSSLHVRKSSSAAD